MATLGERNVAAGAIGRVVGGVAVVRGHCVPEGLPSVCDAEQRQWERSGQRVGEGSLRLCHGGRE